MKRMDSRSVFGVRRSVSGSTDIGAAVNDDCFYAAWMQVACRLTASVVAEVKTPNSARRTPHAAHLAHIAHVSHSSHTPEERKKLHPSVVSRLRLVQRFGRRELRDVPHA